MPPRMEYRLHQEGRLDQLAFSEMSEVIQVANVVALELKARAVCRQRGHRELDILERVAKNQVAAILQMLPLPFMLEVLEPVQQREQSEIQRPHVQGGEFRLEADGRLDAFLDFHEGAATAREVYDGIGALLDASEKRLESLRPLVGSTVAGVAGVKM